MQRPSDVLIPDPVHPGHSPREAQVFNLCYLQSFSQFYMFSLILALTSHLKVSLQPACKCFFMWTSKKICLRVDEGPNSIERAAPTRVDKASVSLRWMHPGGLTLWTGIFTVIGFFPSLFLVKHDSLYAHMPSRDTARWCETKASPVANLYLAAAAGGFYRAAYTHECIFPGDAS